MATNHYSFKDTVVIGGGDITIDPIMNVIHQISAPFAVFSNIFTNTIFNVFVQMELMYFTETKHSNFREALIGFEGIPAIGLRPRFETRTSTSVSQVGSTAPKTITQDVDQERSGWIVPITPIIWIISFVLAFDPEFRSRFTARAVNGYFIPKFMSEVFKRTRVSICGKSRIVISTSDLCWSAFTAMYPGAVGSIIDPSVVLSDTGITKILRFFNTIASMPGNYVPMIPATKDSLPPAEAGESTTVCSLIKQGNPTITTIDFLQGNFCVLSGNFYANRVIPKTHAHDHHIAHVVTSTNVYDSLNPYSTRFSVHQNFRGIVTYVVARVTGMEENPSRRPDQSTATSSPSTSVQSAKAAPDVTPSATPSPNPPKRNTNTRNVRNKDASASSDNLETRLTKYFTELINTRVRHLIAELKPSSSNSTHNALKLAS